MVSSSKNYMVVSSDSHCGPPSDIYREYLEPKYREAYDESLVAIKEAEAKAATWGSIGSNNDGHGPSRREVYAAAEKVKEGGSLGAYDPAVRTREMDRDGVAGEILFPVPIEAGGFKPPFGGGFGPVVGLDSRSGLPGHPYELRAAGVRAHNRWVADFCAHDPARHAGAIIIELDDIDEAVKEINRARKAGLTGGLSVPNMALEAGTPELFYHHPRYEPIWATCEDLGLPVQNHTFTGSPNYGDAPGTRWIFSTEISLIAHRLFWFLLWGGALERHPKLNVVITEAGSWAAQMIEMFDDFYQWKNPEAARQILSMKPSEYWYRQGYLGASPPVGPREVRARDKVGTRNIMWGSDYPHREGTWPYTQHRMKAMFAGAPADDIRLMVGENVVRVYGLDKSKLETVAARIGPAESELANVSPGEATEFWNLWTSTPHDDMD